MGWNNGKNTYDAACKLVINGKSADRNNGRDLGGSIAQKCKKASKITGYYVIQFKQRASET